MSVLGAAALIGTAASLGSQLYKTAADKRRNEELEEMRRREAAGDLGLTGSERQLMEEALMDPVRAQGKEAQARQMAIQGASSGRGGDLQTERQAQRELMAEAGQRAGRQIASADLEEKRREKLYIDQLIADKAQRQAQTVGAIGSAVAQGAKTYGLSQGGYYGFTEAGGATSPAVQIEQLRAAGLDDDTISTLEEMGSTPEGQAMIAQAYESMYGTGE